MKPEKIIKKCEEDIQKVLEKHKCQLDWFVVMTNKGFDHRIVIQYVPDQPKEEQAEETK